MIIEALKPLAVDISTINPDPTNARGHSRRNIDAIKQSLARFGQRRPLIVQRDGMIVRAGNGALQAAKELGWTQIAVAVVDDDDTEAKQFAIADNRTGELAHWNARELASQLNEWEAEVVGSIGFNQNDLQNLMTQIDQSISDAQKAVGIAVPAVPMPSTEGRIEVAQASYASPSYTPPPVKSEQVNARAVDEAAAILQRDAIGVQRSYSEVACPECGHSFRIVTS